MDIYTALSNSLLIEVTRHGEKVRPDIILQMYAMFPRCLVSFETMNGFEAYNIQEQLRDFLANYTVHYRLGDYLIPVIMSSKIMHLVQPSQLE